MRAIVFCLAIFLVGCSNSPDEVQVADERLLVDYQQTLQSPEQAIGKPARWGGVIATIENPTSQSTVLEISHFALDSKKRPDNTLQGSGRFVVKISRYLDPAVFKPKKLLTVVGLIAGESEITVGEQSMKVPVIDASNYYLWTDDKRIKHYYVGDPYYDYYYDRYYYWDDVDIIDHYDDYDYDYGGDFY